MESTSETRSDDTSAPPPSKKAKVEEVAEEIKKETYQKITNEFKWSERIPTVGKKGNLFRNRIFVANVKNGKTIRFVGEFSYENDGITFTIKPSEGAEMLISKDVLTKFYPHKCGYDNFGKPRGDRFDARLTYYPAELEQVTPNQRKSKTDTISFSEHESGKTHVASGPISSYERNYCSRKAPNFHATFASSAGEGTNKKVTYNVAIDMKVRETEIVPSSKSQLKMAEILYNNKELSDVKIICAGITFECHKLVLGCRSEVFAAMFSDQADMVESKSGELEINDVGPDAVDTMIHFMYHDKILPKAINQELLLLADKYMIHDLMDFCIEHLEENLSLENILEVLQISNLINQKSLFQTATRFLCENKDQMKSMLNEFLESNKPLAENVLKAILNLND